MIENIGIWGHAASGLYDGYGYAGYNLCKTLNRLGIQTYWEDETAPVALSFKQPIWYGGRESQFKVGYTPWESTHVPDEWIRKINSQDLFWTTSNWCKEIFSDAGVTLPIRVVPHGLVPEDFTLSLRKPSDYLIFFHMGEPADRKNGQMVFDAFDKLFRGKMDVRLIYKAHGYITARWKDSSGSIIGEVINHPQVLAYRGTMSNEELDMMLQGIHCCVYPSSGEGFGLIPFQTIATGMPTILPNYSGMADFAEFGINVDYTVGPSYNDYHTGDWCWPSFDDLCDKMMYVYENYGSVAKEAYDNALILRERFSWDKIISKEIADLNNRVA